MTTVPNKTEADELLYAVHEFGHLQGAPDHYGRDCHSTDSLNGYFENEYFDESCIYGYKKDEAEVKNSLKICGGCLMTMNGQLTVPSYPLEENVSANEEVE